MARRERAAWYMCKYDAIDSRTAARLHYYPYTCTTVYIIHAWGGFPRLTAGQATCCQIPNDTSPESSRQDVCQRRPLWYRHYSNCCQHPNCCQYPDCGDIDHGRSAQEGVTYTVTVVNDTTSRRSKPPTRKAG